MRSWHLSFLCICWLLQVIDVIAITVVFFIDWSDRDGKAPGVLGQSIVIDGAHAKEVLHAVEHGHVVLWQGHIESKSHHVNGATGR